MMASSSFWTCIKSKMSYELSVMCIGMCCGIYDCDGILCLYHT